MAATKFTSGQYVVPVTIANLGLGMFKLKEVMKTAGWVVKSSGDGGSIYSATTDIITQAGAGANGYYVAKAWVRIQRPDGTGEFILQVMTAYDCRIKYSKSAKFTGGSPSATVTPSATDEQTLLGSGSDASPAGAKLFGFDTSPSQGFFAGADAAAPYGFYSGAFQSGAPSNITHTFLHSPMTTPGADTDPYLTSFNIGNGTWPTAALWKGHTAAGTYSALYANDDKFSASGKIVAWPLVIGLSGTAKGVSTMALRHSLSSVTTYDCANEAGQAVCTLIRHNNLWLPWSGTLPSGYTDRGELLTTAEPVAGSSVIYRMRGKVSGTPVYWNATIIDTTAAQYTGGGTPTDITVVKIIGG